jgi:hypothetical protein
MSRSTLMLAGSVEGTGRFLSDLSSNSTAGWGARSIGEPAKTGANRQRRSALRKRGKLVGDEVLGATP